MSYVKYREDDIKIINDRMFMRFGSPLSIAKEPIRYYECKYCYKIFDNKSDLINHIRDVHNIVRPIIMINDKVVGDHTILQYVHQAKILMYGFDGDVKIGNNVLKHDDEDEIDITSLLKDELHTNKLCEITFNTDHLLIEYSPLSLNDNQLIKSTIEDWQESVCNGHPPNPSHLSMFNGGDLIFIQGVYNYYLACVTTRHKSKRYDDAYAALSQFQDISGIGSCILKVIAFRRNWIDTLQLLTEGEPDVFTTVSEYFHMKDSSFLYDDEDTSNYLFIEDDIQASLELIVLFQKGMYHEVKSKLFELGDLDNFDNKNLIEQLYLLKARISIIENDRQQASHYYSNLITPAFREEYQKFQNG